MAKLYVATLHTGNTLTIHGQTFFKGRPTVVTNSVLIDYLKTHPNFKLDERIVASSESLEDAAKNTIEAVRSELKESGMDVAPTVFEKDTEANTPAAPVAEPAAPAVGTKATVRKGAVSAPRVAPKAPSAE